MGSVLTSAFSMARELGGIAKSAFSAVQKYAGSGSFGSLRSVNMNSELSRAAMQVLSRA